MWQAIEDIVDTVGWPWYLACLHGMIAAGKNRLCLYFAPSTFVINLNCQHWTETRDPMLARFCCVGVSVCSSDRLSVTSRRSRYCTIMAKCRITETTPYDSPVFWFLWSRRNSTGVSLNWATNPERGRLKWVIFDQYLDVSQKRCKIEIYPVVTVEG